MSEQAVQERVSTDWDALAKAATRAKVANAPMQPVQGKFSGIGNGHHGHYARLHGIAYH